VTTGIFYDLAVRDVEIAIAAYSLARVTEIRLESKARGAEQAASQSARELRQSSFA
jgi:hypothetical protein